MALTIRWTKRAEKKFDKIIEYLLAEWNEQVTEAFVKKVYVLWSDQTIDQVSDKAMNYLTSNKK